MEPKLTEFLATQTLFLQQMQQNQTRESEKNAECLRSIGAAFTELKNQLQQIESDKQNLMTSAASRENSSREHLIQNIPWPQPLEVDVGDINENFDLFTDNWNTYMIASGIDKWGPQQEVRKINILLSIVGDKAKKKFSNFHLTEAEKTSAVRVLQLIGERIKSERNLLYDRYRFHTCNQQEEESFDTYYIRLKKILDVCKYNQNITLDDLLRDRLVFGIRDVDLKRKFLKDDPTTLTLEKLKQTCRVKETTDQQLNTLTVEDRTINKIDKNKEKKKPCKFCTQNHPFKKELGRSHAPIAEEKTMYHKCVKNLGRSSTRGIQKRTRRKRRESGKLTRKQIARKKR